MTAHCWAFWLVENAALVGIVKLYAAYAGGLALRHAGDGRTDGRRNAAGTAAGSAIHEGLWLAIKTIAGRARIAKARRSFFMF